MLGGKLNAAEVYVVGCIFIQERSHFGKGGCDTFQANASMIKAYSLVSFLEKRKKNGLASVNSDSQAHLLHFALLHFALYTITLCNKLDAATVPGYQGASCKPPLGCHAFQGLCCCVAIGRSCIPPSRRAGQPHMGGVPLRGYSLVKRWERFGNAA